MNADFEYLEALDHVYRNGSDRLDRTGVGTRSVFGVNLKFDNSDNSDTFPILTTKRVHWKSVVGELLWMLSGSTNVQELREKYGVTIWDEWEREDGTIGPGYGEQWRDAWWANSNEGYSEPVDQMQNLIKGICEDPFSRRHIVNSWNVGQIGEMALPPCHTMFQCYVHAEGTLDLQLYQRSSDMFLGLPFNIAQYALLQHIIADLTGYPSGELHITIGDAHIYSNHFDQVAEQILRYPTPAPRLVMPTLRSLDNLEPGYFLLEGYNPLPTIKAPVAI